MAEYNDANSLENGRDKK
jgi:DNA-directed RNA polymerase II subunit RPB1